MKIWPMAPQAAKPKTSLATAGLALTKAMADLSSLALEGGIPRIEKSGVLARRGETRRYSVVSKVERMFCATII